MERSEALADSAAIRSAQREMGAYYTPEPAARLMAEWVLDGDGETFLEPSMGDGAFLRALDAAQRGRHSAINVFGVELDPKAFQKVSSEGFLRPGRGIRSDFLDVRPFEVDGAIGNPPFVRLRHLPSAQAKSAREAAAAALGEQMDPSGSEWMPFVLHASRFLRTGGRLAFVLPFDFTYVRYARPLWAFLGRSFASLRVIRVRERVFEDLLQEVVLLFASGYGSRTEEVEFEAFEQIEDLLYAKPCVTTGISIDRIVAGERPFVEALLPPQLRMLLRGRLREVTIELRDLGRFNIGYVSGDKRFFHPSQTAIREYSLPPDSLRPAVSSAREVRAAGVLTSGIDRSTRASLFLPPDRPLRGGETRYVAAGESHLVHERYKCRVRTPWWIVPHVHVPDVLLSVFSEEPVMLMNDEGLVASNSLLCGFLRPNTDAQALVAAWYTPLTTLYRELHVHSLGGGVFVLVPNEVSAMRVPQISQPPALAALDEAVKAWDFPAAYSWGRDVILRDRLNLSATELDLIEEGREVLASWRKAGARS